MLTTRAEGKSTTRVCFVQGRGQSRGDGPDVHLQEDAAAAGEAGRHLQEGTCAAQGDHQGRLHGNQGVPVPVPESPLELHHGAQKSAKGAHARSVRNSSYVPATTSHRLRETLFL